jgi:hypothetical protein
MRIQKHPYIRGIQSRKICIITKKNPLLKSMSIVTRFGFLASLGSKTRNPLFYVGASFDQQPCQRNRALLVAKAANPSAQGLRVQCVPLLVDGEAIVQQECK